MSVFNIITVYKQLQQEFYFTREYVISSLYCTLLAHSHELIRGKISCNLLYEVLPLDRM